MNNASPKVVRQLLSWLTAVGIPTQCNNGLVVIACHNGQQVEASFREGASLRFEEDRVVLDPLRFSIEEAPGLFQELQLLLGYDPKVPVDRGPVATNIRHNGSYGEDTVFRHTEFRQAPNPTAADFKRYESVIRTAVRIFENKWRWLLSAASQEAEDVKQYCLIWVTNFIGLHEKPGSQAENDNLCYTYLSQRLVELRNWLIKRARNCRFSTPRHLAASAYSNEDGDLFAGDLTDAIFHPERYISAPFAHVEPPEDIIWKVRNALYSNFSDPPARKEAAEKVLKQLLSELPHEKLVERLTYVATNACCDVDARKEAVAQLKEHAATCDSCREYAEVLAVKVHEDLTRANSFSS